MQDSELFSNELLPRIDMLMLWILLLFALQHLLIRSILAFRYSTITPPRSFKVTPGTFDVIPKYKVLTSTCWAHNLLPTFHVFNCIVNCIVVSIICWYCTTDVCVLFKSLILLLLSGETPLAGRLCLRFQGKKIKRKVQNALFKVFILFVYHSLSGVSLELPSWNGCMRVKLCETWALALWVLESGKSNWLHYEIAVYSALALLNTQ